MDHEAAHREATRWIVESAKLIQPEKYLLNMAMCYLDLCQRLQVEITDLCRDSAAQAEKSGFVGQTLPEFIALVHSELSEALEEHRDGRKPNECHYSVYSEKVAAAIREELGFDKDAPLPKGISANVPCAFDHPKAKPEGIPSEIADVIIRCCHYAGANKIDLAKAIVEKATYNKTRPFKHGKFL